MKKGCFTIGLEVTCKTTGKIRVKTTKDDKIIA